MKHQIAEDVVARRRGDRGLRVRFKALGSEMPRALRFHRSPGARGRAAIAEQMMILGTG